MTDADNISGLLTLLYQAVGDATAWPAFVLAVVRHTRADSSFVLALDAEEKPAFYQPFAIPETSLLSYSRHFYKTDLVLERFRQAGRRHGTWIGHRNSVLPDHELLRSEFYNDFMLPLNQHHQAGANLGITGPYSLAGITLVRSRAAGPFPEETITLLHRLAPHLRQALLLQHQITALQAANALLSRALEATGMACIALSCSGAVQALSPAAEAILAKDDGLLLRNGRLRATHPRQQPSLRLLLQQACRFGADPSASLENSPPAGTLTLTRRSSPSPLHLMVSPFHAGDGLSTPGTPVALLFLHDPDARLPSRDHFLRHLYALTPAEARLAGKLLEGLDLKSAADLLHITEASARFVLQRIFAKTGVKNQSGLMRLALTLPGQP